MIQVSDLMAEYIGPGATDYDAGQVRANYPIPPQCGLYYFEITIISDGTSGYIGIGFCASDALLNQLPGWTTNSWGYHGDDGKKFDSSDKCEAYGPTFSTGDVVGCGINFEHQVAFFTLNGKFLGNAFKNLPIKGTKSVVIFPSVGMRTKGEAIKANFGMTPFVFDINQHVECERLCAEKDILDVQIPILDFKSIISDYVMRQGYVKTFSKIPLDFETKIQQRNIIRDLILCGCLTDAIVILKSEFNLKDSVLESMHVQAMIELIRCGLYSEALSYGHLNISSSSPLVLKTYTLLGYSCSKSPYYYLFDIKRREKLAETVNSEILMSFGLEKQSILERLIQQTVVCGQEAKNLGLQSLINYQDLTSILAKKCPNL